MLAVSLDSHLLLYVMQYMHTHWSEYIAMQLSTSSHVLLCVQASIWVGTASSYKQSC
jgi:hypothetical protein